MKELEIEARGMTFQALADGPEDGPLLLVRQGRAGRQVQVRGAELADAVQHFRDAHGATIHLMNGHLERVDFSHALVCHPRAPGAIQTLTCAGMWGCGSYPTSLRWA